MTTGTIAGAGVDSIGDAFDDHGRLLAEGAPYAPARALLPDARRFAEALTGVYATDPNDGASLNGIMTGHDLAQFD
jgi:flagellum-specific peptidoglycan hydrolase FlgJ